MRRSTLVLTIERADRPVAGRPRPTLACVLPGVAERRGSPGLCVVGDLDHAHAQAAGRAQSTPFSVTHRARARCALGTEVVAVAGEGFIHKAAAAENDPIAEVAYATAQGLSLREGAAGVEDGLDGLGAEAWFGVLGELFTANEELHVMPKKLMIDVVSTMSYAACRENIQMEYGKE